MAAQYDHISGDAHGHPVFELMPNTHRTAGINGDGYYEDGRQYSKDSGYTVEPNVDYITPGSQQLRSASTDNLEPGYALPSHGGGDYQKPPRRTLRSTLSGLWFQENIALFISWACQVALVIILFRMSNQPLSKWTGMISLNAMISIFTTISKSLLMVPVAASISQLKWLYLGQPHRVYDFELFDKASRGPSGSLQFLFRRPLHMASLGCLVTIIASAIGPFTQQVVAYDTRAVSSANSTASFGYAYAYDTKLTNGHGSNDIVDTIDPTTIDFDLRGAVMKGLYNLDLTPEFSCPGTCTWNGTWTTLGFGYSCKDVTEETFRTRQCWHETSGIKSNETTALPYEFTTHYCNMTTPGGVAMETEVIPTDSQTVQYINCVNHLVPNSTSPLSLDPNFMTVAQYKATYGADSPTTLNSDFLNENITECEVFLTAWQISSISSKAQNFTIEERTMIPLQPSSDLQEYNTTTGLHTFNQTDLPEPFNISVWDWVSVAAIMEASLSNVSALTGVTPHTDWKSASPLFSQATSGGETHVWVERVTRALTDAVRAGPDKRLASGNVEEQVIFVRVRWIFYIIPAVTEVGALLLLMFTVWRSRPSSGIPLWRSSALAPLFHDVRWADGSETSLVLEPRATDVQELRQSAKSWNIRLS